MDSAARGASTESVADFEADLTRSNARHEILTFKVHRRMTPMINDRESFSFEEVGRRSVAGKVFRFNRIWPFELMEDRRGLVEDHGSKTKVSVRLQNVQVVDCD
jgi:hypothetical protein